MTTIPYRTALIVGAGSGHKRVSCPRPGNGWSPRSVSLAPRNVDKLASLAAETGAERFTVDASDPAAVAHLFRKRWIRGSGCPMRRALQRQCTCARPNCGA